jgi:hypothetical protein
MDGGRSLSTRKRVALAVGLVFAFVIGCKTFDTSSTGGDSSPRAETRTVRQKGEAPLFQTADGRIEIQYPTPFAANPRLKLGRESSSVPASQIQLLEQHPDRFVLSWNGPANGQGGEGLLSWEAEGTPAGTLSDANATPKTGGR